MTKTITPASAIPLLHAGEIIAYPTEGVYGLGCDPRNLAAVGRLLALKKRPKDKGLILVASQAEQFGDYLLDFPTCITPEIAATWPGQVTWLLPARAEVSPLLRGEFTTQAVRVSAHPVVQELAGLFGHAIVSTSANIGGGKPCMTAAEVDELFGDAIAGIVGGELGGDGKPSEIRSALDGSVLRG